MGINDLGWGKVTAPDKLHKRIYILWQGMITRCYHEKTLIRRPKYRDCFVCDRWLTFSNFLEDVKLIEGYDLWANNTHGYCLDKDGKFYGNKEYALDKVRFTTIQNNSSESIRRNHKLSIPKPIIVTFPDGTEKEFNGCKEASIFIGEKRRCICDWLHGRWESSKGYKVRFKEGVS